MVFFIFKLFFQIFKYLNFCLHTIFYQSAIGNLTNTSSCFLPRVLSLCGEVVMRLLCGCVFPNLKRASSGRVMMRYTYILYVDDYDYYDII